MSKTFPQLLQVGDTCFVARAGGFCAWAALSESLACEDTMEAAQVTVRSVPEWRSKYLHLMLRRGRKTAKVAMARRLAVRLYWMWRRGWNYEQWNKFGSHAGQPGHRDGAQ